MSTINDENIINSMTRTLQIIAGALIVGVVLFLGVATVMGPLVPAARAGAAPGRGAGANAAPQPATDSMDIGDIITWVAVLLAAIILPLSFVVPRYVASGIRRNIAAGKWTPPVAPNDPRGSISREALQSDTGKLAFAYQTPFIIGAALNEGVAFFAAVAYMVGGNPIALGLALLLLGALILRFPTRPRVASWIERQQELLAQDRQAGV
jgi:hypothetical protein